MAEVTSEQIQALTDAVTGLSEKVGSMPKGGGGQQGDFSTQLKENAKGAGKDIAQFAGHLAKGTATVQSFAQAIPLKIFGPFSADTFFIKNNIRKYDSVIGMYHDQILTPFKTLYGFDASNITLGLPFLRMSVDHGPNHTMLGKNISSTQSLENIFNFINSIK